ncbi:MAG: hypothetical protein NZ534_12730, partial [Bacteroidia bacterium]|nr:hypothetical protein [Bacteroidia bacterium]
GGDQNLWVSNRVRWNAGRSELNADQGGAIELGGLNGMTGVGTPYIDFHVPAGNTDYAHRIIALNTQNLQLHSQYFNAGICGGICNPYVGFDWIGAFNCFADVSAWRYFANATNWIYADVTNDLDLIDQIRPMRVFNEKDNRVEMACDPKTMPSFLVKETVNYPGEYIVDITRAAGFTMGAVRELRAETKTRDAGLEARIERLEKFVAEKLNAALESIPVVATGEVYKGMDQRQVMDGRLKKDTPVVLTFTQPVGNYHIRQHDGGFLIVFDAPLQQDATFHYSFVIR